jgi:protein-S-isoprenylcysteine O-methyltransferase Ste14
MTAQTNPPPPTPTGPRDAPQVWVHPPVLFIILVLLGYGLDSLLPLSLEPRNWPWESQWPGGDDDIVFAVGCILIGLALIYVSDAVRRFLKARTSVPTFRPATALVTDGVYRYTRNPMYVAMILLYAAIGLLLKSLWYFVLLAPLIVVLRYGVVAKEEAYLEAKFGDDYRSYKERVKRRF